MRHVTQPEPPTPEIQRWITGMAEKMGESAIAICLFTKDYAKGMDSLLQFAVAIMLDKPIFLLVPRGVDIPERVRRVADGIELYTLGDTADMQAAAIRLLRQASEKHFTA